MTKVKNKLDELALSIRNGKKLDVLMKENEDGEIVLSWEFMGSPRSPKSELDYFKELKEEINRCDKMIYELGQYCEKNKITYSFKLCKSQKLETDDRIPVLLTSYISVNFPANDYYFQTPNESIPDADEEFKLRETAGLI